MSDQLGSSLQTWRNAALVAGEQASSVGPDGYYEFTPDQWLGWISQAVWQKDAKIAALEAELQQARAKAIDEAIAVVKMCDEFEASVNTVCKQLKTLRDRQ